MNAPRSYLFVPGDRPERFEKAFATGCGLVPGPGAAIA